MIVVNACVPAKHFESIVLTLCGIAIEVRLIQLSKEPRFNVVMLIPDSNITDVSLIHAFKNSIPSWVTLAGIRNEVKFMHFENA